MARRRRAGSVQSWEGLRVSVDVRDFDRQVRQLKDNDTRRAMREAGKRSVKIAEDEVKKRTPVGSRPKRGQRLFGTVKGQATSRSATLKVGSKRNFHAWFVHEGHRTRGGSFVKGRPFIREGISEVYSEFLDVYRAEISQVIDEFNSKH